MPLSYTNPGSAFGSGFESLLMQRQQEAHQQLLDDLAQKRELRMAQADLDSHMERQDELARKKASDAETLHTHKVKEFQDSVKGMVKGDRPTPEQLDQEKALGLHVFTQPAAPTSVTPMQPPAALMEQPPENAPAEGVEQPTPAGAVQPQPVAFPGTPKEREDEDLRKRREAWLDKLDPAVRDEVRMAFEAESLGLKSPTGLLGKTGNDGEAVMKQNAKTGTVERLIDGQWVTWTKDVPKGAHWMTEPQPKDTTAQDTARENSRQRNIEHANLRLYNELGKGELSKIVAAGDIQDALAQNTEIADATLAPLVLKSTITAGGNSGFRMTKPEIDRVLTRDVWDDLKLKLNAWTGSGPLQLTPTQKAAMRKLGVAIYEKAAANYAKINDAEDAINNAKDAHEINSIVTKTKRMFEPAQAPAGAAGAAGATGTSGPPPAVGRVRYDESGMLIPQGAQ